MTAPSASNVPSLLQHLDVLYPLAQVLAGPDDAGSLLQRVYERAAKTAPEERPDDPRAWLFGLMVEVHDSSMNSPSAESERSSQSSLTEDPFRKAVARETAERALPVAFAACSSQERVLLTLDALSSPSDDLLASALRTSPPSARSMCDEARSALRAALRDVLTGPERMLVDVALPEKTLQETLRDFLGDRFQPTPSSLQSELHQLLHDARADQAQDASRGSFFSRLLAWVPSLPSVRSLLIGLAVLIALAAGAAGMSQLMQPTPEPSSSVVELSTRHTDAVQPELATSDAAEAERFVQSSWNRRVSVPSIERAELRGVGRLPVTDTNQVPVFLYTDTVDSTQISAFAYSYSLLDQLGAQADLAADLRNRLTQNEHLIAQQHAEHGVVLWRHRDDIFVTVASAGPPQALRDRIRP